MFKEQEEDKQSDCIKAGNIHYETFCIF